ncbi:hypothetical protein TRFO_14225 [Tritrichomonas foetus]|uniref:Nucleoplasmin-like domain-containing protein n=1 Tax=Tritrichomonas foetus TaxID=1144522 RepID=A0A1J4KVQ9_9EUKA|nr:hypothetical protein TRFO_14225 [Tritrichomonas foetus]|eukprot:OHT15315.1 hypothetical protein TRFO_14225 [Tritrichomonas foetus]
MELPSDFNAFWAAMVVPGKPCTVFIQEDSECSITNISLHFDPQEIFPPGQRVILSISVNGSQPVAIAPFVTGQFESTFVDLRFTENDRITLVTEGAEIPVDVVGHMSGAELSIDNGVPPPSPIQPQSPDQPQSEPENADEPLPVNQNSGEENESENTQNEGNPNNDETQK